MQRAPRTGLRGARSDCSLSRQSTMVVSNVSHTTRQDQAHLSHLCPMPCTLGKMGFPEPGKDLLARIGIPHPYSLLLDQETEEYCFRKTWDQASRLQAADTTRLQSLAVLVHFLPSSQKKAPQGHQSILGPRVGHHSSDHPGIKAGLNILLLLGEPQFLPGPPRS